MSKKFLIVTEGSDTEPEFLVKLFEKYGFIVQKEHQINVRIDEKEAEDTIFKKYEAINETKDIVIIAQGPRNRIRDLIKLYNHNQYDIEKFFTKSKDTFAGIFLIYDVDQTLNKDLENAFKKFNNEQDGLLLVSSPCVEVLAHEKDININEIKGEHLSKEYKPKVNTYINAKYHITTKEYIFENFESIALKYLNMNFNDFNSANVMEHPQLIINMINKLNIRELNKDNQVHFYYRYFSTVIYVCVAFILGLTKEEENVEIFKKFLKEKTQNKDTIQ